VQQSCKLALAAPSRTPHSILMRTLPTTKQVQPTPAVSPGKPLRGTGLRIGVLMTCHNRRAMTVRCLNSLLCQQLPPKVGLTFYVVDDGSTDGTASAVRALVPAVNLQVGDGTLFWNRGMLRAWTAAQKDGIDFFWAVNDDTVLFKDALQTLLRDVEVLTDLRPPDPAVPVILSGATIDPSANVVSYGAATQPHRWHPLRFGQLSPNGRVQECAAVNMNSTLISRGTVDSLGLLSRRYRHSRGDFDYSLRARKLGIPVGLASKCIATCDLNPNQSSSSPNGRTVGERFRRLRSVKYLPVWECSVYYRRHGGVLWPFSWLWPYLKFWLVQATRAFVRIPRH
jgi:GT2 family glycosyltransferase